jgi:DNA repair protein RecO (recombination protein O)
MVYAAGKKKSGFRAAFMQPLSLVELDVYHLPNRDIQQIRDVKMSMPFTDIPFNPVKNSIALFVSELLYRTLRNVESEPELFHFLQNAVLFLDNCVDGLANFHPVFMVKLAGFLGFEPNMENAGSLHFDMSNGTFTDNFENRANVLHGEIVQTLAKILKTDFETLNTLGLSREKRREITDILVEYYRLHAGGFHGLNSLRVLHELFN